MDAIPALCHACGGKLGFVRETRAGTVMQCLTCREDAPNPAGHGLMSACRTCGSPNGRTGKQLFAVSRPPAFGSGPPEAIRSLEYECSACGQAAWSEDGTIPQQP